MAMTEGEGGGGVLAVGARGRDLNCGGVCVCVLVAVDEMAFAVPPPATWLGAVVPEGGIAVRTAWMAGRADTPGPDRARLGAALPGSCGEGAIGATWQMIDGGRPRPPAAGAGLGAGSGSIGPAPARRQRRALASRSVRSQPVPSPFWNSAASWGGHPRRPSGAGDQADTSSVISPFHLGEERGRDAHGDADPLDSSARYEAVGRISEVCAARCRFQPHQHARTRRPGHRRSRRCAHSNT